MHGRISGPVYAIYYPLLAAIGVPAAHVIRCLSGVHLPEIPVIRRSSEINLVAIVILSRGKCGLSRCISRYLVSMAVTDLLVVITAVIFNRIIGIYFPFSFMSLTPACTLSTVAIYAATESSVWLTVAFTFDRFVAICCPKLNSIYCTERTAAIVIGTICVLSCLKSVPWYFIYEPQYIVDNKPWFCSVKPSYNTIGWTVYDWFARILNPGLPFVLILLLNALTVRHILVASRARARLMSQNQGDKQSDAEMESRRKSIILLFAISGSFILLWMTYVVDFLYVQFSKEPYFSGSNFNDPRFIRQESGNMLQLLSSCTNTCIYVVTQRKFREEIKNAVLFLCHAFASLKR
ncbi:probable G-protein coupled receptor 139 [Leucoraja erinacea]|uniref:probable G-protein coupled receptor 139 n=1 Tax=Leucoraja erinaceus TaxID=7782 RepID=UPI002457F73D|nr:probable G-protein coupled receptor 139 [Leucoraja erinacea]